MNCTICQQPLDPVLENATTHPTCFPFAELEGEDPFTNTIKTQLIEMVLWAEKRNPRASQVPIGPSEIGDRCDRRLGYRIAEVPAVNTEFDPWAAIMGTAIHSWMEVAITDWTRANRDGNWVTETTLVIDDFVRGHADLYSYEHEAVIDYKTVGPDVMRKVRKNGPTEAHQIQTHVYGYGFTRLGDDYPVKKVCLVFLPRAGWLKDMYVWCTDYNQDIALGALYRLYQIATQVTELDTSTYSHRWEQIPATPSNDCGWCPWYDPGRDPERGADTTGCPGR